MKDNMTNIEGTTTEVFNEESYKKRMAAYVTGVRKYRLKEAANVESKKKADRIGGGAL